jgi:signal transduction histidine kinase
MTTSRSGETINGMSGATVPPVDELWQSRLDRFSRIMPLPLLAVGLVLSALLVGTGFTGGWPRFEIGLGVAGAALIWTLTVTGRPSRGTLVDAIGFAVHSALAAVLVWVNPFFGLFAFSGYFFADRLPRPWSQAGVVLTAAIMAGSQMAGYPTTLDPWLIGGYLLIASVNAVLALSFVGITDKVLEQNAERGLVIAELAETNRRLEQALAENAGLHAQLLSQAREAGVLDERQRLAGEIHDTLAQGLVGIVTQLEAAEQARNQPAEWSHHLHQARELARSGVMAARRSVRALRPEQLENTTLVQAIDELARSWRQTSGVAVRTETTGCPQDVPADVEAALFRVAQEALTNVAKHANASMVGLTLTYLDDVLLLDVRDDGAGFDAETDTAVGSGSYGLAGMRERLSRVGGRLEVESVPGEGTTVNASVPTGVRS